MQTDVGPVRFQVPRDRAGAFEPQIVPKHVRRLTGFSDTIVSLYAKGLTTGEIEAHLAEVYDAGVSRVDPAGLPVPVPANVADGGSRVESDPTIQCFRCWNT
ncbi:hypothetical protein F4553_001987 [Allocatelliglobosispora scoriae]|uniref:Mutator family transposase n=1 Tax=Allocatelliglobosispora scoriae TaxID=643052 RepID=A0A841BMK4_9ACTN|nr:hypothetical protein [Allocatelliglobosispora scoriae]